MNQSQLAVQLHYIPATALSARAHPAAALAPSPRSRCSPRGGNNFADQVCCGGCLAREKGIRAKGYPQKDDPSLRCLKESMWTVCSCSNAARHSLPPLSAPRRHTLRHLQEATDIAPLRDYYPRYVFSIIQELEGGWKWVDRRQAVGRRDPLLAEGGVVLCRQSMVGESSFEKSVRIVV